MTVLNEASSIPSFLESLGKQSRLPDEFIVVDGGSSDGTTDILRKWTPPPDTTVRVLAVPGANISRGRNIAIRAASHELVAVTDAGTSLEPTWLESLVEALTNGADVAAGFFVAEGNSTIGRAIAATITPLVTEIDGTKFLPSSRSIAFTRNAWEKAGGYPEWLDYCEDLIFDLKMQAEGMAFEFVPKAIVTWNARPTMRSFAQQYFRYARGDGKSGLWWKRHALRYGVYSLLLVSVGRRKSRAAKVFAIPTALAYVLHQSKFINRVLSNESLDGQDRLKIVSFVPLVVVIGDVSKMAGYPAGLIWRARTRLEGGDLGW